MVSRIATIGHSHRQFEKRQWDHRPSGSTGFRVRTFGSAGFLIHARAHGQGDLVVAVIVVNHGRHRGPVQIALKPCAQNPTQIRFFRYIGK